MRSKARILVMAVMIAAPPACAANILSAGYDASRDEIVLDIVYRGTNPQHHFAALWGHCSEEAPHGIAARLVDDQGSDAAREEYRVRERLSLEDLPCRPAVVTLRLGRVAHARVFVPVPPRPLKPLLR